MANQIPPFDEHGNLPPGIHYVSVEQIEERYGLQNILPRVVITTNLLAFIDFIREFSLQIYINGSYVTSKLRPGDADVLLILPADFDFESDKGKKLMNYINNKGMFYLDIFPFPEGKRPDKLAEMLDGWTHSNDVAHRLKGILSMVFRK